METFFFQLTPKEKQRNKHMGQIENRQQMSNLNPAKSNVNVRPNTEIKWQRLSN